MSKFWSFLSPIFLVNKLQIIFVFTINIANLKWFYNKFTVAKVRNHLRRHLIHIFAINSYSFAREYADVLQKMLITPINCSY